MFQNIGEILILLWRTVRALPLTLRHRRKVGDQLFEIGNASLLMACILSLFIGGVIALQTGPRLAEHPAHVHDPDTRPVDPPGKRLSRDQRPIERPTHRRLNVHRR